MADKGDYCEKCQLSFEDRAGLRHHLLTDENHNACKKCWADFLTVGALREHWRQYHPAEQDISCRCGQRFNRAGGLLAHIADGECSMSRIARDLEIGRMEQLLKDIALSQAAPSGANDDSQDPPEDPDDLISFKPIRIEGLSSDNPWSTEQNYDVAGLPGFDVEQSEGDEKKSESDEKTSGSKCSSGAVSQRQEKGNARKVSGDLLSNPTWAQVVVPIPALEPMTIKPTPVIKTEEAPSPKPEVGEWAATSSELPAEFTEEELLQALALQQQRKVEANKNNPYHPSNPEFSAGKFYNRTLRVYVCPYARCRKTKNTASNFISHLESPAHQDDKITCRVCLRVYNTPSAYMQHFESQGKKCKARETGNKYLEQATGGVIAMVGENHDGTNKYDAWVDKEKLPLAGKDKEAPPDDCIQDPGW